VKGEYMKKVWPYTGELRLHVLYWPTVSVHLK